MLFSCLWLNPVKMQFIGLGISKKYLPFSTTVLDLGVTLDKELTISERVKMYIKHAAIICIRMAQYFNRMHSVAPGLTIVMLFMHTSLSG